MMNSDGTIDFSKLEKELFAAVEQDARYQRENDAKFRAIEQKVASYEEFKDIVAASHLKPLDKKDTEGMQSRQQPWNPYASKQNEQSLSVASSAAIPCMKMPKNSHEFLKHWRQFGDDRTEKYAYLLNIGGVKLCDLFKTEIPMGLLGEIIVILQESWNSADFCKTYQIMQGLSAVKRFNLSLQFLSNNEKKTLTKLFINLSNVINEMKSEPDAAAMTEIDGHSLIALKEKYGVNS